MKKFLGTVIAIAGAGICIWAGSCLLVVKQDILGYHPMYTGLVGISLVTIGIVLRQD